MNILESLCYPIWKQWMLWRYNRQNEFWFTIEPGKLDIIDTENNNEIYETRVNWRATVGWGRLENRDGLSIWKPIKEYRVGTEIGSKINGYNQNPYSESRKEALKCALLEFENFLRSRGKYR
jgi:hypothetical protein